MECPISYKALVNFTPYIKTEIQENKLETKFTPKKQKKRVYAALSSDITTIDGPKTDPSRDVKVVTHLSSKRSL